MGQLDNRPNAICFLTLNFGKHSSVLILVTKTLCNFLWRKLSYWEQEEIFYPFHLNLITLPGSIFSYTIFFFPYRKQLSAMYKPLTFKNLPFKHVMSLDVCIELPEITRWHILAYFIHISNAWLTGLKSTNVNREQNRGLGVLVLEQKMNHHCWQSLLGQRCLSHGFEWPLLFLVSAPLTSTHSPSHEHTPKATPRLL